MFRHILLASVGAIALAGSAFAADLPSRAPPPVYIPPAPIFTWTGIYIGGQVGYAWGKQSTDFGLDVLGGGAFLGSASVNGEGVIGGAHVGYNLQLSQFVIGLEGSVDGSSIGKTVSFTPLFPAVLTYESKADIQGSIRGRLGYAWDRVLIYGTGGVAFAGTKSELSIGFPFDTAFLSSRNTRVGWTVGGGLEYAITNNWSIRAEYRYSDFGHSSVFLPIAVGGVPVATSFANRRFVENQVQVGFSYKFDTPAPAPVVAKY